MEGLRKKIIALFEYRRLPWMIEQAQLSLGQKETLYDELLDLQEAIFLYDEILEKSWKPSETELAGQWDRIRAHLTNMDNEKDATDRLLHEIAVYAQNELSMREGRMLSDLPIEEFYYYKSCDVRLMRKLILAHSVKGEDLPSSLSEWRTFDLITEVNDDLSDLEEDAGTYNGNRFLQCLTLKGPQKAFPEYQTFLEDCVTRIDPNGARGSNQDFIVRSSREEASITLALLKGIRKAPLSDKIVEHAMMNERIN